ncbi:helix-turn-helix transcriptional regulator [Nocardioides bruguierae]|uniref:Helix-turn-helix domain-containing protein n=1 Tax=Nocardioides bruguierae TaxID=2945102 RepID=A0A9X2III1_9ACTN|nr:helix-turn-helix domain-containing protein [Nocardioides bruguierae]MCM0622840.1 helix-turn-helix domain-containing protein [Nocardioides bruguierae]
MTKKHPQPSRRLVPVSVAADYAGVSPKTIRRRIAQGELVGYRLGTSGRTLRVDLTQVEALLQPIPTAGA